MNASPHLRRWIWPALSLLCGFAGAVMLTSPPPQLPQIKPIAEQPSQIRGQSGRSDPLPSDSKSFGESSTDPVTAWPAAVARQMASPNYLDHARTVWLPAKFVGRYRWNLGTISGSCKLSPEAKRILDVTEGEAVRVEAAINRFVAEIRETERRYAQVLEKTGKTIKVRVPSGLTPNGPRQQLEAELLPILGAVAFQSLYSRLVGQLQSISPVISGKQFDLESTLLEGDKMETRIESQGGGWSTLPFFPEHYAHLLPAIVGTGDKRRWQ